MTQKQILTKQAQVAILGSGNIGTDLMYKLLRDPGAMELALFVGIDPASEGLARAKGEGVAISSDGVDAILENPDISIVFDATSARAHVRHAAQLREVGKVAVDLTPAARGPFVVPTVNLDEHLKSDNVNLITCGGQATIPLVHAISRVTPLHYAEMVSTVASLSAGPGTRHNIDEFTETTALALQKVGGAAQAKAIMILNPADPPIMMTNTVYAVLEEDGVDEAQVLESLTRMEKDVKRYVPGYSLRSEPQFSSKETPWGKRTLVTLMLEVAGAGDFLPAYAGNLDIMTAAAREVGNQFAQRQPQPVAELSS